MAEPTIPYDRVAFHQNLSDLQDYLAELRYIDRALDYMSEEESSWWHGIPLVGPEESYMDVQFGTTFPFKKTYKVPEKYFQFLWEDSKKEPIKAHLQELAEEANSWAATEVGSITSRIEPFTWPIGSLYESRAIEPLEAAHDKLEDEVSTDFGKLGHSLGDWEGPAADNFATYFYHPFEHTLRSQKQLLAALAGGLVTAKAIAEATQHSLMNVVHYVREELREQLELRAIHAERVAQESKRNALIIAGGAATFLAGLASGNLWATAMGTVVVSSAVARTTIPTSISSDYELRGATAEELLNALSDAVGEIDKNESERHEELRDAVAAVLGRVENLRRGSDGDDGRLIPIRPDIVDGVDGDDFNLP